jgi:hypothetical protein
VKLGGFNAPTQDVSGACGSARNETITAWAQKDAGATTWPTPGMLMMVAFDRFAAAAFAPAREVNVSKLPEMRSVGMLLATGWRMAVGAAGTFQTSFTPSRRRPHLAPRPDSRETLPDRRRRDPSESRTGSLRDRWRQGTIRSRGQGHPDGLLVRLGSPAHEHADAPHVLELLRQRGEGPGGS